MLYVVNDNSSEFILTSNYEKKEMINAKELSLSFTSYNFDNNPGHKLLEVNSSVFDADQHEYKIRQITETNNAKNVTASHVYYDLIGFRKYGALVGYNDFNRFASWLFNGTGWTFTNDDITGTRIFNDFGNDNVLRLIDRLINQFDCEIKVMPNKTLKFARRIGQDNDKQYRYKSNVQTIRSYIDATNLRTRITATGANGLTVTYTSPLAYDKRIGFLDAEPVENSDIRTESELMTFAQSQLTDYPETNLEVSVLDTDGEVGDYVWIIYEPLNLQYRSRILSKTSRSDNKENTVEIGNVELRTIEDFVVSQKEEIKENKEAIEETNETIVETEENLRSEITQTASSIRLEVQQVNQSVASLEITANQIQSNVTNLATNTSSSITQLSNNINLKVDKGGTISDINLSPGTATINASKINLNGAVMVNGSITGSTDITVNRNVAVGNALYFGGTQGSIDFINISGTGMTLNSTTVNIVAPGGLYVNGTKVG